MSREDGSSLAGIRNSIRQRSSFTRLPLGTILNIWSDKLKIYQCGIVQEYRMNAAMIKYMNGTTKLENLGFMQYEVVSTLPLETLATPVHHEKFYQTAKEELKCGICLATFENPMTHTRCMHTFCSSCISDYVSLNHGKVCPWAGCNSKIDSIRRDYVSNSTLANLAQALENKPVLLKKEDDDEAANVLLVLNQSSSKSTQDNAVKRAKKMYNCHTCGGFKPQKSYSCGPMCVHD